MSATGKSSGSFTMGDSQSPTSFLRSSSISKRAYALQSKMNELKTAQQDVINLQYEQIKRKNEQSLRQLSYSTLNSSTTNKRKSVMGTSNAFQEQQKLQRAEQIQSLRNNDFINLDNIQNYIEKAFNQDIIPSSKQPALLRRFMMNSSRRTSPQNTQRSIMESINQKVEQQALPIVNLPKPIGNSIFIKVAPIQETTSPRSPQFRQSPFKRNDLILQAISSASSNRFHSPQEELQYIFEQLIRDKLYYQQLFSLKFNLVQYLREKGYNPTEALSQDQKVNLFNTLLDVIFQTNRLHKTSFSPPPSPLNRKKYHYFRGWGKHSLGGKHGEGGSVMMVAEDSEALRKLQEIELAKRGISVSESTRKQKTQKVKVTQKSINIIEQNKLNPRIKRMI